MKWGQDSSQMYPGNDFECLLSNIQSSFWKKATLEQLKHLKTTVYSYICWEKKKNKTSWSNGELTLSLVPNPTPPITQIPQRHMQDRIHSPSSLGSLSSLEAEQSQQSCFWLHWYSLTPWAGSRFWSTAWNSEAPQALLPLTGSCWLSLGSSPSWQSLRQIRRLWSYSTALWATCVASHCQGLVGEDHGH